MKPPLVVPDSPLKTWPWIRLSFSVVRRSFWRGVIAFLTFGIAPFFMLLVLVGTMMPKHALVPPSTLPHTPHGSGRHDNYTRGYYGDTAHFPRIHRNPDYIEISPTDFVAIEDSAKYFGDDAEQGNPTNNESTEKNTVIPVLDTSSGETADRRPVDDIAHDTTTYNQEHHARSTLDSLISILGNDSAAKAMRRQNRNPFGALFDDSTLRDTTISDSVRRARLRALLPGSVRFFYGAFIVILALGYFGVKTFVSDASLTEFEEPRGEISQIFQRTFTRSLWYLLGLECITSLAPPLVQGPVLGLTLSFSKPLGLIFFTLMTVFNVYISTRLSLAIPAMMNEYLNPMQAIQRSWALTGRFRGLALGRGVMQYIAILPISMPILALFLLPFLALRSVTGTSSHVPLQEIAVVAAIAIVLYGLVSILGLFIFPAMRTVNYYDFIMRNEDADNDNPSGSGHIDVTPVTFFGYTAEEGDIQVQDDVEEDSSVDDPSSLSHALHGNRVEPEADERRVRHIEESRENDPASSSPDDSHSSPPYDLPRSAHEADDEFDNR